MNETEATSCGQINPLMLLVFPCCRVGLVMAGVSCSPKHRGSNTNKWDRERADLNPAGWTANKNSAA